MKFYKNVMLLSFLSINFCSMSHATILTPFLDDPEAAKRMMQSRPFSFDVEDAKVKSLSYEQFEDGRIRGTATDTLFKMFIFADINLGVMLGSIRECPGLFELAGKDKFQGLCHDYALGKGLGINLERDPIAFAANKGEGSEKYKALTPAFAMDCLKSLFTQVTDRRPGDLAVYSHSDKSQIKIKGNQHFGFWCVDGFIESKWGTTPVLKHLPFCALIEFGDLITTYRLNPNIVITEVLIKSLSDKYIETLLSSPFSFDVEEAKKQSQSYEHLEDGSIRQTAADMTIRKLISEDIILRHKFGSIECPGLFELVSNEQFHGLCYDYALGKVLGINLERDPISFATNTLKGSVKYKALTIDHAMECLKPLFVQVKDRRPGDLGVYSYSDKSVDDFKGNQHFGIWCGDGFIESRWGSLPLVLKHLPFCVGIELGDLITSYRLNPNIVITEELIKSLSDKYMEQLSKKN